MTIKPTLTFRGLYNYDSTIFDTCVFPDGVDADTVISHVMWDGGDLELLYSNADYIKTQMTAFCAAMSYKWGKLYDTLSLEYNPIENYDRIEEYTDNGTANTQATRTDNLTNSNASAPFNEESLKVRETDTQTGTVGNTGSNTTQLRHQGRIHGNIGVTTSQQMLESERDVAMFNLYKIIADDIINYFCISIW